MNFYIDIEVRPDAEFSSSILMNEVYFRLHQLLVKFGQGEVGVSFPKFAKTLGPCLRIHGDQSALQRVMSTPWTSPIEDYIVVSGIKPVPEGVSHRVVQRLQIKSSPERLLRRSVKKGWITEDEATRRLAESRDQKTSLPYIRMRSLSTGQLFRIFIEHGLLVTLPQKGEFSAYGLSTSATIPWF